MIKRKTILIAAGITVAIICLLLLLLVPGQKISVPKVIPIKTQERQVAANEAVFQKKIDSLNKKGDSLSERLSRTKELLSVLREKNSLLQHKVHTLISPVNPENRDLLSDNSCDTLKAEVKRMMMIQKEKDDLQDSLTTGTEMQLHNKNAMIAVQQQQYLSLKSFFDNSLQQQKILLAQNKTYRKTIRMQRIKQKVLFIGLSALSVFSLKQFLKR